MDSSEEKLLNNQFITVPDISDVSEKDKQEFFQYYEKKTKQDLINKAYKDPSKTKLISDPNNIEDYNPLEPPKYKFFLKNTLVDIISSKRNKKLYPYPNNFSIFLGKGFSNVYKIQLKSIEFPNSASVIRSTPFEFQNNKLYWINQEDIDLNFPIYSVDIRPGSYSTTTLAKELAAKLNAVPRRNGTLPYLYNHFFIVSLDKISDIVTFTSLINQNLLNNSLEFIGGNNVVTVNQLNHGYLNGQKIYLQGSKTAAGIKADSINGIYTITYISKDKYSIEMTESALVDSPKAGGNSVKIGIEAPFKLLFGNYSNTFYSNIGFLKENSCELIPVTNPLTTRTFKLDNIIKGEPTIFFSQNHGLIAGQKITLNDLICTPQINNHGLYTVHEVLTQHKFSVDIVTGFVDIASLENAYIGTGEINVNFPLHGFNSIVDITETLTPGTLSINTFLPHNLETGDSVTISQTNCIPSIDGTYIINKINTDTFEITMLNPPFVTVGTSGIIGTDNKFYLYGITETEISGIDRDNIQNIEFSIYKIIDDNNFTFRLSNSFAESTISGGGSLVRISSWKHGFRGIQQNTMEGYEDLINRPINLSGENYTFLCSNTICRGDASIINSANVQNTFARISLDVPPMCMTNSFLAEPKVFYDNLIISLSNIDFQVRNSDGSDYQFNDLDYSMVLSITEIVSLPAGSNFMSQLGFDLLQIN